MHEAIITSTPLMVQYLIKREKQLYFRRTVDVINYETFREEYGGSDRSRNEPVSVSELYSFEYSCDKLTPDWKWHVKTRL